MTRHIDRERQAGDSREGDRRKSIAVGLVDDHPAMILGMSAVINTFPGMRVVGAASTVEALLAGSGKFDVVLLDLQLADGSTPRTNVERLTDAGAAHQTRVVAFTSGENARLVREAAHAGVSGMIRKSESPERIMRAIEATTRGETIATPDWATALLEDTAFVDAHLTRRESEVLARYASGQTAEQVAKALFVSRDTVLDHLRRIRGRYAAVGREAPTKIDLHMRAAEDGLV
jgi:DNA-binding NarL/FixJ family response regulator